MEQLISVIVPIYNVGDYIKQCVDGICNQTYKNLEIVLVDDGSTDGCHEICDEYKEKDDRIVVVHKKNGGLVSARKAGIQIARGDCIAYVDGDDWIEPDMYEKLYGKMAESNADIVMCGHYEDIGSVHKEVFHTIQEGRYGKKDLLQDIYPHMVAKDAFYECDIKLILWAKLFRRKCVEQFQLAVDEHIVMGEDAACVFPCLLNVGSIYVMHECLYHYRQSGFSIIKEVPAVEVERERFRILDQTVNKCLEQYIGIYDLREQWKIFMLSLMVPRADGLYEGFDKQQYLFPFSKVAKGSRIVIYGAGTYGQRLYQYLGKGNFCEVVAWVDQNYIQLQNIQKLPVENPKVIWDREYDAIIIAIINEKPRQALYEVLIKQYPKEKVHMLDKELIFSQETYRAFNL